MVINKCKKASKLPDLVYYENLVIMRKKWGFFFVLKILLLPRKLLEDHWKSVTLKDIKSSQSVTSHDYAVTFLTG